MVGINKVKINEGPEKEENAKNRDLIGLIRDKTLPGGVDEFLHVVWKNYDIASIFLEIPIYEVKDIKSAIEKVEAAGFDARVVNWNGYEYLQISKKVYSKKEDQEVVEKLKTVAIDVSKEDYSDHIRQLRFEEKEGGSDKVVMYMIKEHPELLKYEDVAEDIAEYGSDKVVMYMIKEHPELLKYVLEPK